MTTIPPFEGRLEDVLHHIARHSPQGYDQQMQYVQVKGHESAYTIHSYLEKIKREEYAHMTQTFLDHPVRFDPPTIISLRTGGMAFIVRDENGGTQP